MGVPHGTRTRNHWFHRPVLCQIELEAPFIERIGRVSRVLFLTAIYLACEPRTAHARPRRRLRDCSRLRASASNLITARPEIAAGRIALFTPEPVSSGIGLCCSHGGFRRANMDCQRHRPAFPRLSPGTLALCSSDFPLAPWPATILSDITRSVKAKACNNRLQVGGAEGEI